MKKSEAVIALSEKLQKSKNLFDGYKKGSITLKCLCDNLADRALNFSTDKIYMVPPDGKWKDEYLEE